MSVYVMSDLHGEADLFHEMLERIGFSETDTLYILGDVIDRGPDGIQLLQEIIRTPNMIMLMRSHEYMMLHHYRDSHNCKMIPNWNQYGNSGTIRAFRNLSILEQDKILSFLDSLPSHIRISLKDKEYYLVHGFPGSTVEDEVRTRPRIHDKNPIHGSYLIIGHTPVFDLMVPKAERAAFIKLLEQRGERPRFLFAKGFIDIDCGCSYQDPMKTLGCLRLDDLNEYYVCRENSGLRINSHKRKVV